MANFNEMLLNTVGSEAHFVLGSIVVKGLVDDLGENKDTLALINATIISPKEITVTNRMFIKLSEIKAYY